MTDDKKFYGMGDGEIRDSLMELYSKFSGEKIEVVEAADRELQILRYFESLTESYEKIERKLEIAVKALEESLDYHTDFGGAEGDDILCECKQCKESDNALKEISQLDS